MSSSRVVLVLVLVLAGGCARGTLDAYDKLALAPVKIQVSAGPDADGIGADLQRALAYYVRFGGLFREVHAEPARADAATVIVEPIVLRYERDAGRPLGLVVGGRARGNALIRYVLRDRAGDLIDEETLRSFARSGAGVFVDVPAPLGGIDATLEGAGAELHWWVRRNKHAADR